LPRIRYRIISVFTLLATLLALLLPGEQLSLLVGWWPWGGDSADGGLPHMDKVVHSAMFAICGYFIVLGWLSRRAQIVPLYLGLLALGGGTEWLQGHIPGRGADSWDIVANAAGAAAGVAFGLYLRKRKRLL